MNRREFITETLAGIAATQIPGVTQLTAEAIPQASLPRAHWLANGLIDAGGSHEPYIFVVRRGGQPRNARELYEQQQSEPLIHRLKEQGIEVFHTHLYKGFGMTAEKSEMEDTKRIAEIAHRDGLRVDTYIQWNSLMYETFFAEEPRAKDWIERDITGQPILLTYGYQQSYRYRPCFANQEYLEYMKKIVRYAVLEVKTDFIHFDNFDLNPEPDSCHCPVCVQGFRRHLKAKYSPEKRRERFGFENVDFVNPPQWNPQNPPQKMDIIFDPAIQEWVDYRCQVMADALKQVALFARSLNPDVVIEVNPHGITGENRAWQSAIDHARILKWTDVFWTEEDNQPGLLPDGRLIGKIRSFKLARTYQNILLTHLSDDPLSMAECLAFNQTIGYLGEDPLSPVLLNYVSFYRKYRDLFLGTEDVAPVAVFRSHPSITYHNSRAQLSAILMEQALIQARIPFGLIFDEHLRDLSRYQVVILPDSECLSDQQIEQLRDFVEHGGGLFVTGQAGLYDEWRRLRVAPGLRGLVEAQLSGDTYIEHVDNSRTTAGAPVRKEVGKGRVVYFPGIEFDGLLPSPEPYFAITNRYWKMPKNSEQMIDEIRWAAGRPLPVRISGPSFLVANLVSQPAKKRDLLHLLNYDARNTPAIRAVEITCQLPEGTRTVEARMYSPDFETPHSLEASKTGTMAQFVVPEVKLYTIVAMHWRN